MRRSEPWGEIHTKKLEALRRAGVKTGHVIDTMRVDSMFASLVADDDWLYGQDYWQRGVKKKHRRAFKISSAAADIENKDAFLRPGDALFNAMFAQRERGKTFDYAAWRRERNSREAMWERLFD